MWFVWFSYYQTVLHHAVWCGAVHYYLQCGVMRLYHFASGFDAVYAVWWTPLIVSSNWRFDITVALHFNSSPNIFTEQSFPLSHFLLYLFSFSSKFSDHISSSPFPTMYVQKVWSTKWGWDEHFVIKDKIPRTVRLFTGDCELCHHRNLHRHLSLFSWSSPRCKLCSLSLSIFHVHSQICSF